MTPDKQKAVEFWPFWICKEEFSNRALVRDEGEKWPDDVKSEPSDKWLKVVEYEALRQAEAEIERLKLELTVPFMEAYKDHFKSLLADKAKLIEANALMASMADAMWMGAFHHPACPYYRSENCACAHDKVDKALAQLQAWKAKQGGGE